MGTLRLRQNSIANTVQNGETIIQLNGKKNNKNITNAFYVRRVGLQNFIWHIAAEN